MNLNHFVVAGTGVLSQEELPPWQMINRSIDSFYISGRTRNTTRTVLHTSLYRTLLSWRGLSIKLHYLDFIRC